jgi:hypothetical protein
VLSWYSNPWLSAQPLSSYTRAVSHAFYFTQSRWQGVFVNVLEQSPQMKEADDGLLKQGWTSKEVRTFLFETLFVNLDCLQLFH